MNRDPRLDRFGDDNLDWLSNDELEDEGSSEDLSQANPNLTSDKPTLSDQLSQILNSKKEP